uniref:Uncharacterized protein n=1 Tax=Rhizophora mucronata TaxID=61149 RepID=A0A2P2PG79_RHIMU
MNGLPPGMSQSFSIEGWVVYFTPKERKKKKRKGVCVSNLTL